MSGYSVKPQNANQIVDAQSGKPLFEFVSVPTLMLKHGLSTLIGGFFASLFILALGWWFVSKVIWLIATVMVWKLMVKVFKTLAAAENPARRYNKSPIYTRSKFAEQNRV